jgi:hypothetical protein
MSSSLKVLDQNRRALLLAEVGAWLHDMGKCTDEMITSQALEALDQPSNYEYNYKTAYSHLVGSHKLSLLGDSTSLQCLIERPGWILRVLVRCHGAAHIEKEEAGGSGKQRAADTRLSTPFGVEKDPPLSGLTAQLQALPFDNLSNRSQFQPAVKAAFLQALGDTRRPRNEITLWDWSHIVAALYKAALAGAVLLGNKPDPKQLRWRLLAIRFDSTQFVEHTSSIPALLARKQWLSDGLDRVRSLLEEDYPLGTEVYRDENGSIFVVPDIANILDYRDEDKSLNELIQQKLQFDGELVIMPLLDEQGWWAQGPHRQNEIPPIAQHLSSIPTTTADPSRVATWWSSASANICTICGVRPQGPGKKAEDRKVCDTCEQRGEGRFKDWLAHLDTTIWLDEVADVNGRICLVAGQFALNDWLKPEGFVETLLIDSPDAASGRVPKTPSFARLRRIWETTRQFWQDITNQIVDNNIVGKVDARLHICGTFKSDSGNTSRDPVPTHAYEILSGNTRISIACVENDTFLVIENLQYIAQLLNKQCVTYADAGAHIQTLLDQRTLPVEEPTGYGSANKPLGTLHVTDVKPDDTPYTPVIPILAEPRTFMALVPADRALAVAEAIKRKYETEMGKVRNRLPLTLGLVFADRRMPLVAILDAGRRMLQQGTGDSATVSERWKVKKIEEQTSQANSWPVAVTLKLCRAGQTLELRVPTVMGDGSTPDKWYPYWCVEQDASGNKPTGRQLQFTGPDGNEWVHVCQLKAGDTVAFMPSWFDFVFLDTAARRFAVSYERSIQKDGDNAQRQGQPQDGGGRLRRRGPAGRTRPYYLEQLGELTARSDKPAGAAAATPQSDGRDSLWDVLAEGLATTQIHNLVGLIETKRQEWEQSQETFEQLVHDAILNANWQEGKHPAGCELKRLQDAAISGELADVVELHMQILKRK